MSRRPTRSSLRLLALESRIVPSTLFVDDDRVQDPAAQYTSIQAAVNDAKPGDTIQVFPGLYSEVVTVDKQLTLIGSGPANARDRTGDTTQEAVVQGVNADPLGVINLRANNIVLEGFTVQGNTQGPGVFTDPAFSGYDVENNMVWKNNPPGDPVPNTPSGGLHINSNGKYPTEVRGNALEDHTAESFGDGVYTELTVSNARTEGNYFSGNVHYSVDFAGAPGNPGFTGFKKFYPRSSDVVVTNNVIDTSGGVLVQYADRITVSNNTITNAIRTGIYVGGDVHGVTVAHNILTGAAVVDNIYYHGKHTGIFVGTLDIPGAIQNVVVSGNSIDGYRNGIWLAGDPTTGAVTKVTVQNNTVQNSSDPYGISDPFGYGILLIDADANTVQNNLVTANQSGGIYVDAASSGNTFSGNSATGNGGYDLYDGSTGRGTGGTANTWTGNTFGTAYPSGLH
jgi:parallel beta-helix repeat protein